MENLVRSYCLNYGKCSKYDRHTSPICDNSSGTKHNQINVVVLVPTRKYEGGE